MRDEVGEVDESFRNKRLKCNIKESSWKINMEGEKNFLKLAKNSLIKTFGSDYKSHDNQC